MEPVIIVFVVSLMGYFLAHLVFFFTLNKNNRPILNVINITVLVIYSFVMGLIFLEQKSVFLHSDKQNFLLLGWGLLLFFVIKDYYSGTKSQGVLFTVMIMLFADMGLVNIYFKPDVETIGLSGNEIALSNAQILIDQLSVVFFTLAILYSVCYHYALREIKSHQPFFFSNRFLSFQRLKLWIDIYLIAGCLATGISLLLGFEVMEFIGNGNVNRLGGGNWEMLYGQFLNVFVLGYFLLLLYIRYRNWFSSKLNLYWMILSIGLLIAKVVYW